MNNHAVSLSGTLAPTIGTERLLLRPHQPDDLADCAAMWSDPAVFRYTTGSTSSKRRTWLRVMAYRGHWAMLGYGYWAVEEKVSGRYIGELGFADFKRDIQPHIEGMPELGWALAPRAHGKGYAIEALRAAVSWGDSHFGQLRTACIIHRDNAPSFRVAGKLDYKILAHAAGDGGPHTILIRTPSALTGCAL